MQRCVSLAPSFISSLLPHHTVKVTMEDRSLVTTMVRNVLICVTLEEKNF